MNHTYATMAYPSIDGKCFDLTVLIDHSVAINVHVLTAAGNPSGSRPPPAMPLVTADIGIQLLIDSTVSLQEIEARRITARVIAAVHQPERDHAARAVLEQLLAVLDATSPDGVI